jgi:DNA ligase 1
MATERSKKTRALQKASEKNVMLAHKFNPNLHIIEATKKKERPIKGWHVYEKIDGIRAVFKDGQLFSRYGNKFHAPQEFIDKIHWPLNQTIHLDGELVHPEGLQKTGSIVRDQTKKNTMDYWKDIQYVVFDQIHYYDVPFWERIDDLKNFLSENNNVKILDKLGDVDDISDIHTHLKAVEAKGGEGLILRNPDAYYTFGRSWDLIKVKSFEDCEAEIVGYYPGEGKYTGMIGGLGCKLDDGTLFECGTGLSDADRLNPPKKGSRITIKYMGKTDSGCPRHAVFVGVRDYE